MTPPTPRERNLLLAAGALLLLSPWFGIIPLLRGYLAGFLLCLAISLGSLGLTMMHVLTGGGWGWALRRRAEAAAATLPWLSLASLPLLLGMRYIFPWGNHSHPGGEENAILLHRAPYYTTTFVTLRWAAYFAVWSFLALTLNRCSRRHDEAGDPALLARARALAAPGLVAYFITMSLAAVDWIGSREVDWYSSTLGLLTLVGQAATALSLLILVLPDSSLERASARQSDPARPLHDLGNLLQTIVVLWAYVGFAQFLVIWCGNTQEDITWFHHRTQGIWRPITILLMAVHFGLPFIALMFQPVKRSLPALKRVAAIVLAMRFLDLLWSVVPSGGATLTLPDVTLPLAMGLLWFAAFERIAAKLPPVPRASFEEATGPAPAKPEAAHG